MSEPAITPNDIRLGSRFIALMDKKGSYFHCPHCSRVYTELTLKQLHQFQNHCPDEDCTGRDPQSYLVHKPTGFAYWMQGEKLWRAPLSPHHEPIFEDKGEVDIFELNVPQPIAEAFASALKHAVGNANRYQSYLP